MYYCMCTQQTENVVDVRHSDAESTSSDAVCTYEYQQYMHCIFCSAAKKGDTLTFMPVIQQHLTSPF